MRFEEVAEDIERLDLGRPGEPGRATRETVRAVQAIVARAIADEEFCVDCIELDLASTERPATGGGVVPFFRTHSGAARFGLVTWAPGQAAGPHEHTDWTVTSVFHNELEVETFDYEVARVERRLQRKNVFSAARGRVGHIFEPCIHDPRNPTRRWSVSLHVFGPNDRPRLDFEPLTAIAVAPDPAALPSWHQVLYRVYAAVLATYRLPRAAEVLARLEERGDARTKAAVRRALRGEEHTGDRLFVAQGIGPLEVAIAGGRASLTCRGEELLAVDAWAEEALRFVAEATELEARSIPGPLDAAEREALCEALVDAGAFFRGATDGR